MSEGKPTAMTAAERSPERISPRDMKTDWFEGSGSIKNLISEFQSQWIKVIVAPSDQSDKSPSSFNTQDIFVKTACNS